MKTTKSKKRSSNKIKHELKSKSTKMTFAFFDELLEKLASLLGDENSAYTVIAIDFGYRNLCGIDKEFPRGKSPLAIKVCELFDLSSKCQYDYDPKFVVSMISYLIDEEPRIVWKYYDLLERVRCS